MHIEKTKLKNSEHLIFKTFQQSERSCIINAVITAEISPKFSLRGSNSQCFPTVIEVLWDNKYCDELLNDFQIQYWRVYVILKLFFPLAITQTPHIKKIH